MRTGCIFFAMRRLFLLLLGHLPSYLFVMWCLSHLMPVVPTHSIQSILQHKRNGRHTKTRWGCRENTMSTHREPTLENVRWTSWCQFEKTNLKKQDVCRLYLQPRCRGTDGLHCGRRRGLSAYPVGKQQRTPDYSRADLTAAFVKHGCVSVRA